MKCVRGYDIEVLRSGAGYYIGTRDDIGLPNCRISNQYAKNSKDAEDLPMDRQNNMENCYCNGGRGCFRECC